MKPPTIALLFALLVVSGASGATVFSHSGSTDPIAEAWSPVGGGVSVTVGPVINDLGSGLDAWFVDDASTAANSLLQYQQTPDAATHSLAATSGWSLSVSLRVAETSSGASAGMFSAYQTGATNYKMEFDREADGDPTVTLTGLSSFTLEAAGDGGYHQYELIYDPAAGSADLFVDGVEQLSNYTGIATGSDRVVWGAQGSNATGRGHFNSVEFVVVPEPACCVLTIMGSLSLVLRRRRLGFKSEARVQD